MRPGSSWRQRNDYVLSDGVSAPLLPPTPVGVRRSVLIRPWAAFFSLLGSCLQAAAWIAAAGVMAFAGYGVIDGSYSWLLLPVYVVIGVFLAVMLAGPLYALGGRVLEYADALYRRTPRPTRP
jgi:hypothetical protein